jgi:hypothetical protein
LASPADEYSSEIKRKSPLILRLSIVSTLQGEAPGHPVAPYAMLPCDCTHIVLYHALHLVEYHIKSICSSASIESTPISH